jgi:hypothetical protein
MNLGLDSGDYAICMLGILVVAIVDLMLEKKPALFDEVPDLPLKKRWAIYYALILAIVWFGAYGVGYQPVDLIYAGF